MMKALGDTVAGRSRLLQASQCRGGSVRRRLRPPTAPALLEPAPKAKDRERRNPLVDPKRDADIKSPPDCVVSCLGAKRTTRSEDCEGPWDPVRVGLARRVVITSAASVRS